MRSSTLRSLALLASLAALGGCPAQGSQPAPTPTPTPSPDPSPPASNVLASMSGFVDEICACTDSACRNGVDEKARAFVQANEKELEAADPTQMGDLENRYRECQARHIIVEFSALTDKMCGCKDAACAEGVNKEFEGWMKANANVNGSADQQSQARELATRYTECMMTAMGSGSTTAAPGMGEKCGAGDSCAAGLECVKYYGIAGKKGGEFSSCERRCGKGKGTCPDGQRCATIADGPGQVCRMK